MSGSRRFLLFLVLASVTCVVLVQISMDGKNVGRTFQYSGSSDVKETFRNTVTYFPTTLPKTKAYIVINTTTSTTTSITTAAPMKKLLQTTKQYQKKIEDSVNGVENIEAKVQVRRLPLAKKVSQPPSEQQLVNRRERLQEILKQGSGNLRRPSLDPMRSLKSIPFTNPDKVTRIIILTYFRAGSTFFGDILQQNWKTFYHFEPLHYMTYDKRIGDSRIPEAFDLFNNIFRCNFSEPKSYMQWVKLARNQFLFARNLFLWVTCHSNPKTCFNPSFVNAVCLRSPVHVMKVTRLHMRDLRSFLEANNGTQFKVVYLTRDPRGILSSRWSLDWCNGTNCSDSGFLCREMDEDIEIFNDLQREQPLNFIKVQYEDLSSSPEMETKKLFQFLNLPFSPSVKKFLRTHTTMSRKADDKNPYSTRRNSSSMVMSWLERFSYKQILDVQSQCGDVLYKLNHSLITSPKQLPYPNGKPKPTVSSQVKPPQQWRFNKNPLAQKYFANNKDFLQNSSNQFLPVLINSNNTKFEIHKSYKFIESHSTKNASNRTDYLSSKNTVT